MQSLPRSLLLLVILVTALRAQSPLENVRGAQRALGPEVWSQVLRIENRARGGHYARTVYALVFEFNGLLWFYTDADGTQSFSLHYDDLAAEKADFAPLLRDIEPGFARWSVLGAAELERVTPAAQPRNACFIESLALWRGRAAHGEALEEPRLLSYYFDPDLRRSGHTVLAFREEDTVRLIDPRRPWVVVALPRKFDADPLALARELGGREVWKARFLPLAPAKTAAPGPALG